MLVNSTVYEKAFASWIDLDNKNSSQTCNMDMLG